MSSAFIAKACACLYQNTYYCALPLDGAQENNAVLMFDTMEGTWLLREGVEVEAFLPSEDALYYTSATTPGYVWIWHEDSWKENRSAEPMRWVTPWIDFGRKDVAKSGFTLYLTCECRAMTTLRLSVQTEKKLKTKELVFTPPAEGQFPKQRRVVFGGNGRRFRLIIENADAVPWRLTGGLQLETETDAD